MSVTHNVSAFVAGEVSPQFYNRTDLSKYPLGMSECVNFFVNFEGGVSNRPGSQFLVPAISVNSEAKLMRFRATGNDFVLLFEDQKMRPMQGGGYLLDAAQAVVSFTPGATTQVEVTGHGLAENDLVSFEPTVDAIPVELYFRVLEIRNVTANTFDLYYPNGSAIDSSGWDAVVDLPNLRAIATLDTPYLAAELPRLELSQNKLSAVLTHNNHAPRELIYDPATETFSLSILSPGTTIDPPTGGTIDAATGSAGIAVAVTAVGSDGIETISNRPDVDTTVVNYAVTEGQMRYTWDNVPGAQFYNVYRSLILPTGTDVTYANELGFIGRALDREFVDNNIIPDFTKLPPIQANPFANGAILDTEVTAAGTGYNRDSIVTITDAEGTGAEIYPVVNEAGEVLGLQVIKPGSGYVAPTLTISDGSGVVANVTSLSGVSGNYPAISARFQQRQVFAGTVNEPDALWGTKPGTNYNFDVSRIPIESDAYNFTLDSEDVNPIRHLVPLRQGLIIFTNFGVFQLRASTGVGVSATNAITDPQAYKAVSDVTPVAIDLNILFTQSEGSAVYSMNYTYYTESFQLQDITILASHLFTPTRKVERMEFLEEPDKLVYCQRTDGRRLICTYEPDQEVIAWTRDETQGLYRDVLAIRENGRFTLYQLVDRFIDGFWQRNVERQYYRDFERSEDAQFVDAGLSLELMQGQGTLTLDTATGTGTAESTVAEFTAQNVGNILYAAGGKATITGFISTTKVDIMWLRDADEVIPQEDVLTPVPIQPGDWEFVTPTNTVSGLWHLEGEPVAVLADGDFVENITVTNGQAVLGKAYSKIIVGLSYTSILTVLPPSSQSIILQDKRKTFLGAAISSVQSRGISMGAKGNSLYEVPNRTYEDWGEPIRDLAVTSYQIVQDGWDERSQMQMAQTYPLPATIIGLASTLEIGDDA